MLIFHKLHAFGQWYIHFRFRVETIYSNNTMQLCKYILVKIYFPCPWQVAWHVSLASWHALSHVSKWCPCTCASRHPCTHPLNVASHASVQLFAYTVAVRATTKRKTRVHFILSKTRIMLEFLLKKTSIKTMVILN